MLKDPFEMSVKLNGGHLHVDYSENYSRKQIKQTDLLSNTVRLIQLTLQNTAWVCFDL